MDEGTVLARSATMREVAEKARVSVMTVSLALRDGSGADRMSAETRRRVLEAAKELGYTHNARARALRLGRTNILGLYAGHGYINVRLPFFSEVVSGLQEGCEQVRRDLLLHGTFHGESGLDVLKELADGRIDGLIVTVPRQSSLARHLADVRFAVVAIADALPGIPSVVVDDADGSRQLAEHLSSRGHRKVVYVTTPDSTISSAERRLAAFVAHAEDVGIETAVERLHTEESEGQFVNSVVASGATAVVCWNDVAAYGLLASCAAAGIRVPEDLAVTGFDGVSSLYGSPPALTTVEAPWAEVARTAVLHLDARLKGRSVPLETVLPVGLVQGTTT